MLPTAPDICDFDRIYSPDFQYCAARSYVESFLKSYTLEEQARLFQEISTIFASIVGKNPDQKKIAVISAGAPGAGKTTIMRKKLERENVAYIDPDDVCLKQMTLTWKADKEAGVSGEQCYKKWRDGSNLATHLILANLIREGYAFYFGTTGTSPKTADTFKYLKDQGYRIHLIHVIAPGDVCSASVEERNKSFVQVDEKDVIEKRQLFPQRVNDTYLKYADQIEFWFRDGAKTKAALTATWVKEGGKLQIFDGKRYQAMVKVHNAACGSDASIRWENSVAKRS